MSNLTVLWRRSCQMWFAVLCYAAFYFDFIDCQKRKQPKNRMERGGPRNSRLQVNGDNLAVTTGFKLLTFLLLAIFVPPVLIFIYNVYKDPLTLTVIKDGWEVLKERTIGSLSKKKES